MTSGPHTPRAPGRRSGEKATLQTGCAPGRQAAAKAASMVASAVAGQAARAGAGMALGGGQPASSAAALGAVHEAALKPVTVEAAPSGMGPKLSRGRMAA